MKATKIVLGVLALSGLFSFSAFAQENGNRDENGKVVRGAYETNRFGDNWFVSVGAGMNTSYEGAKVHDFHFFGGLALDANVGKWLTPSTGARFGWRGINNSYDYTTSLTPDMNGHARLSQNLLHADLLWNISNAFSGYKETRTWNLVPYASAGLLMTKNDYADNKMQYAFADGLGLLNNFRLSDHVGLYLDLAGYVVKARETRFENAPRRSVAFLPSATLGLTFNLGRTNWDRHSSITPVVVPVPFTTDQYNALKDRVAALEKENADLKDQINALKNQQPDTVYVDGNVESGATVYFTIGQTTISDREKAHVDYYVDNVLKNTDKNIVITGSADKGTGSAKRNQYLSEQRAKAVKDYLVKAGVDESRISTKAVGDTDNRFNGAANNRVAVIELD